MKTASPVILRTVAELRTHVRQVRASGKRIALVPTMGALHDGHMALVREGLKQADHVIATIFVNPTQFGPNEDFSAYPRTWDADLEKLARHNAGAVFHPAAAEMYPPGAATAVTVHGITDHLDGPVRPGHFQGVATIVTKLLLQALPDIALFGEKDYQQLQVIKRMVQDLNIPVDIIGVPTMRDANGLALSSRNTYLSAAEYEVAVKLNGILFKISDQIRDGMKWHDALAEGRFALDTAGFDSVDYLEVRDSETLSIPPHDRHDGLRVLAAVRIGKTRLIDNVGAAP